MKKCKAEEEDCVRLGEVIIGRSWLCSEGRKSFCSRRGVLPRPFSWEIIPTPLSVQVAILPRASLTVLNYPIRGPSISPILAMTIMPFEPTDTMAPSEPLCFPHAQQSLHRYCFQQIVLLRGTDLLIADKQYQTFCSPYRMIQSLLSSPTTH